MKDNKDKDKCHEGAKEDELIEQTWIVNKENKGVENVIIFLKAPEGKFFKIKVVNDAKFNHNTKWAGAASKNPGNDKTLTPGNSFPIDNLEPDAKTPVTF